MKYKISGKLLLLAIIQLLVQQLCAAQSVTLTKKRPPILDVSEYQKVAVGDIVGPEGTVTARAMDLNDQLTSLLFNAKTLEVIDRNALSSILSADRKSSIKAIDENTTALLSKKLSSAIMILGRIQTEKVYTEQKSQKLMIYSSDCPYNYWWEIKGEITAQVKILDVKTGKMLFSNPITQPINIETTHKCEQTRLGDIEPLLKETLTKLAKQIAKLVVAYDEEMTFNFQNQAVTLFKNPFKKLNHAAECLNNHDYSTALAILKEYADDKSLKPALRDKAIYNYGLGLFVAEQYETAVDELKIANKAGSLEALNLIKQIDEEKLSAKKQEEMLAKAEAYKRQASQTQADSETTQSSLKKATSTKKSVQPVKKKTPALKKSK